MPDKQLPPGWGKQTPNASAKSIWDKKADERYEPKTVEKASENYEPKISDESKEQLDDVESGINKSAEEPQTVQSSDTDKKEEPKQTDETDPKPADNSDTENVPKTENKNMVSTPSDKRTETSISDNVTDTVKARSNASIIALTALVTTAVLGVAGFLLFGNKNSEKENNSSKTQIQSKTSAASETAEETKDVSVGTMQTEAVTTAQTTVKTTQSETAVYSEKPKQTTSQKPKESEFEPYEIRVINDTTIYDSPSYNADTTGEITDGLRYTIVDEYVDPYGNLWGKLKSGKGWININDATYDIKTEEPNVWCPECGEGFFTTGIGTDGLTCPNCGYSWFPEDVDYTDYNEYIWNRHSIKNDFGGEEFLDGYTEEEIQTFINEILARNGYQFKEKKWLDLFSEYDWYYPDTSDFKTVESRFCDYEKENYYLLAKYRNEKFN